MEDRAVCRVKVAAYNSSSGLTESDQVEHQRNLNSICTCISSLEFISQLDFCMKFVFVQAYVQANRLQLLLDLVNGQLDREQPPFIEPPFACDYVCHDSIFAWCGRVWEVTL